jgi:hypothetical protein
VLFGILKSQLTFEEIHIYCAAPFPYFFYAHFELFGRATNTRIITFDEHHHLARASEKRDQINVDIFIT